MKRQNEMMEFVWLLNEAANSSFEVKELCRDFIQRRGEFKDIRKDLPANSPQGDYLEGEISRNLESFKELGKLVCEVIEVLGSPETAERGSAEQSSAEQSSEGSGGWKIK